MNIRDALLASKATCRAVTGGSGGWIRYYRQFRDGNGWAYKVSIKDLLAEDWELFGPPDHVGCECPLRTEAK